ncbi:FtsK/SpoIIIE domain-containing protein [Microbacterium horticulturae]|uniref:FtsK/SpoIIIE domain-containing protein n=1 Tax=Microbacterium horticulturae TaxID=3028316 RepID=A0ABY8C0X7_9MICO|nr:FtsK/SpoIIIE domain-containing protein [Microbacterium sp. KACC 23027]WEG09920.1 FtsK/SpoIIIE domain-containing protein [Microbacterium sp. KACC 23027]
MTDVIDDVLRLPDPAPAARRSPLPLIASAVPVLAGVGLWLATGTVTMLWFAALGPLIAVATVADGVRAARRQRRLAARDAERTRRRVGAAVAERHEAERVRLWTRTPDLLGALDEVWRPVAGRGEQLVVGRGPRPSTVRVEGGRDDAASAAIRAAAAVVADAPVTVPLRDGVVVVGPAPLARAVHRALLLQLCLVLPPDRMHISADGGEEWVRRLPHVDGDAPMTIALAADEPGDAALVRAAPGAPPPPRCGAVLALTGAERALLTYDGGTTPVRVEGISAGQAGQLADALRRCAQEMFGAQAGAVALAEIADRTPANGDGLDVVIGSARGIPYRLDLVADGPHAVVAGITGSGKSELLTTWITALCLRHGPDRVTFLLADFKGGTAFDALVGLPHVAGVISDLDTGGAARALESLRAELRRREAAIVAAGARDVAGTDLPRLIIVVDEFAALTAAHPDLVELFTDIAARGRALGMHLILGTQRAAGTFRDALLANCPLRISLRVTDPADSSALLGGPEAAGLPGAPEHRGLAYVRRGADGAARRVRVALTSPQLVAEAAASASGPLPRRPWLPALPERIALTELRGDGVMLGLADEPERQRQSAVLLDSRGLAVVGRAGSGRTTVLAAVAAQCARPVWVGADPEAAWDALTALDGAASARTVLVDDLDALLAQYPPEYAHEALECLERLVHAAGPGAGRVVLSAQRVSGPVARLADLLPQRAILAMSTRADFAAAGGVSADWRDGLPPGRGVLGGRAVQFAQAPGRVAAAPAPVPVAAWVPCATVTAAIGAAGAAQRRVAEAAAACGATMLTVDEATHTIGSDVPSAGFAGVVMGDGEQWQRAWRLLQMIRARGELLVDGASAADHRVLTGDRALLPYCRPGRGRAWRIDDAGVATRVVVGSSG